MRLAFDQRPPATVAPAQAGRPTWLQMGHDGSSLSRMVWQHVTQ